MNRLLNAKLLTGSNKTNLFSVPHIVRIVVLFGILYTVLVTAWLTDDALISFRHIWNFIQGDGITFNFGERVQGFSHPLWFLILSCISFVTNDILLTSLVVSIIFSIFSVLTLMLIEIKNDKNITIYTPAFFLLFSYAYCDFTSSGLENPLAYFLIGLILWFVSIDDFFKNRQVLFLIFALLILTRFDYFILILPLAVYLTISKLSWSKKDIVKILIDAGPGLSLIIAWIIFSIIYFGFPLPNTYYAKLSAGFPLEGYIIRGLYYILELIYDPSSFVIIVSGLVISFYSRNRMLIALSIGQLLYIFYIIYIGGDFMRGRFFSTIVYLSVGQIVVAYSISKFNLKFKRDSFVLILVAIIVSGFADFRFPFMSTENYVGRQRLNADEKLGVGMQDERGFFYQHFGLFSPKRDWLEVKTQLESMPNEYEIYCGQIGALSLFWKSNILKQSTNGAHLIDFCALTDPLLSKIPAIEDRFWRIGHNIRKTPSDYGELMIGNIPELPDENLRELSNDVILATRGEIFTSDRLKAIWRLNTGYYSDLDFSKYTDPSVWVPSTTKTKTIHIENWDNDVSEQARPNINIISMTPMTATGLTLIANPSYMYEIQVNNELIATNLAPDDKQMLHLEFSQPILVHSIEIRTIGISDFKERWWLYTYRDKIDFQSLWPTK